MRSAGALFLCDGKNFFKTHPFLQKDTLENVSMKNFVKYTLTRVLADDIM
ncbi:hypothetical protein HMPREF9162_0934 [Selenomonas sp. oral taxon 137 str. F0430]|nr:hypothetical protein HMPREF9162_0934 [Selenomonas sp. oral taxon 137 str. F0430]